MTNENTQEKRHSTSVIKNYRLLKRTVQSFMLDGRSAVAREIATIRAELARDAGGADQLSAAQLMLIDSAAKGYLLLEAIDGWLFTSCKLVDRRRGQVHRAALDRMRLADSLCRQLSTLGLEKKLPGRRLTQ